MVEVFLEKRKNINQDSNYKIIKYVTKKESYHIGYVLLITYKRKEIELD